MGHDIYAVVMAGGKGTRLWPLSMESFPKQYLPLVGEKSFLAHSIQRLLTLVSRANLFVVTEKAQEHLAQKEWKQLIVEPCGKNTAPCIYLSLLELREKGCREEDLVGFFPADHYVEPVEGFQRTLGDGFVMAEKNKDHLVLLGLNPTSPHTGYGYMEKAPGNRVKSFREKPSRKTALMYLKSGNYLWNGGMFMGSWRAFYRHFQRALDYDCLSSEQFRSLYKDLEGESFDRGVLEGSFHLLFVEGRFHWLDVGEPDSLKKAHRGNRSPIGLFFFKKEEGDTEKRSCENLSCFGSFSQYSCRLGGT